MSIEPFDFTYTLTSQSKENEVLNALEKGRIKEFEPKSYFFTESTIAAQSTAEGAYGPDYVSTNTKFNITTQFELANKKAYAVTSGQVLIVPQSGEGNESKVNVFIKPLKHVDVGVPIKYYVYRGLKKDFFINSSNKILPKDSTNTPFITKVWTDLVNFNELKEPLPEIPASLFGYSTTETDTNSLDAKFFNTYNVASTDENKAYNLPIIEAGQYFGEFKDNKGGFEIVLNDGFYYQEKSDTGFQFDLNYAKAEKTVLDIADIANDPNISEKIYRENVQKFLDPAAFYGGHITEKEKGEVKIVDIGVKYSTKADIYNNIVSKFSNKNKCYIYLQGNTGRSFNFDEALGADPLKIGVSESLTTSPYKTNEWPIIINEFEQTHTEDENEKSKSNNDLSLQLKFKTDSKNVTIYNTYGNCVNAKIEGNFLSSSTLLDEANIITQNYTNTVNYKLINNYNLDGNSLVVKNISTFIYINHKEEEENIEYFNDFFGPLQIDHLINENNQSSKKIAKKTGNLKNKILKNNIDGETTISNLNLTTIPYLDPNGTSQDDLFKIYVLNKIDDKKNTKNHIKLTSSADIKYSTIETTDDYGIFEYGNKNYKVWKGHIDYDGEEIKTLQLINLETEGNVTNFMQLGLMNNDYKKVVFDSLTSTATNHIPESYSNFYFHLEKQQPTTPNSFIKKYSLGIKAEKFLSLISEIIYPSPQNTVYVYTVDGNYFFTKEFAEKFNFFEEFADASVSFKPQNNIIEHFGLDWMRLNEGTDIGYEDSISSGYVEPKWAWNGIILEKRFGYASKPEAFDGLKKEYITIATKQNNLYYIPFLSIYPATAKELKGDAAYEANLTASITIHENLSKLELDYDTSLFEISTNLPTNLNKGIKNFDMRVFCSEELKTDQYIKFIAYSQAQVGEQTKAKLAGIIKVCKNNVENRKKIKIVLIPASTDIEGDGFTEDGIISTTEIENLKYILYQSRICADIEKSPTLDLTGDENFKMNGKYINGIGEMYEVYPVGKKAYDEKQDYLKNLIDSKYKNHFKVFIFELPSIEAAGNVQAIGKHSVCLYRKSDRADTTLAHEICHGLGLYHSHVDGLVEYENQKFTYPKGDSKASTYDKERSTDNIMSYNTDIRKSTWQWQWEIMHNNIKDYVYEN